MEEDKITGHLKLLIIGGSAGSLPVLFKLFPFIKSEARLAIIIVLHRKSSSDSILSHLLATRTALKVCEIEDKQPLKPAVVYIAPPDYHILFETNGTISLDYSEKVNYSRPSLDVAFETAAQVYGPDLACLLLSGASSDGTKGLEEVKKNHGKVAIQKPETADSPYMPQQAINRLKNALILTPEEMPGFINGL
jgi:two-component system chemotaxis response regulator CheB